MPHDEIHFVHEDRTRCDGNGKEVGHPRVYLDLFKTGEAVCPYCSKRFKRVRGS